MTGQRQFRTTSLVLAASLLTEIPGSLVLSVSQTDSIDGKKIITLSYDPAQESEVNRVVEAFQQRRLTIPLYPYNVNLNQLRDRLHRGEKGQIG